MSEFQETVVKPDRLEIVKAVVDLGNLNLRGDGMRVQLKQVVDTNSVERLFIPAFSPSVEDDPNLGVDRGSMSDDQKKGVLLAMRIYKLPFVVAVHEVMNNSSRIESWTIPSGGKKRIPALVPFVGPSSMGKSSLLAALAIKKGVPIFDMDIPSGRRIADYVTALTSCGLSGSSSLLEIYERMKIEQKSALLF